MNRHGQMEEVRERRAVSEVAGTMLLIGIIVVGMIIVNLVIFSSPNQGRVPSLRATMTNRSTLITIVHQGGDALWTGEYQILVDGVDQTGSFLNSGSNPWSIGDTLSWTSPTMPHKAVMVYNGSGRSGVVILETKFPWGVYVPSTGGSGSGSGVTTIVPGEDYPWYDCSWGYRKNITINHLQVSGTQTSFPVLISLSSDSDLSSNAQSDGDDILFTTADGVTKIPHEIESYSSGTLVAWVKVPSINSVTDTTIIMYYGNSGAASQQDKTNVWDSNFKGVWHLKEDPSGAAPQMKDSTSNALHGTSAGGMTSGDQVAGKMGGSLDLDGQVDPNGDSIRAADYDILNTITVSGWINWDATRASDGIVSKRTANEVLGDWALRLDESGTGKLEWMVWTAVDTQQAVYSSSAINTGAWKHVAVTFDDSTNTVKFYINGALDNTDSMTNNLANTPEQIAIGWSGQGDQYFDGRTDEVHLSNTVRSAQWIATEYANQNSPSSFSTVGSALGAPTTCTVTTTTTPVPPPSGLPWYDCNWAYRKNITIDKTKVSGTQTGFPVLLSLTADSGLSSHAQSDGDDIFFTDVSGTKIPHEIESYSAGTLVAWVRVPQVSSAADSTIVMYYGNAGASSQQNAWSVWDNGYQGVWHLKENPAGSAPQMKDSSESSNHGSSQGSMTAGDQVPAKINGGLDLDGSDDYINSSLWAGQVFTLEAWIKRDTTGATTVMTKAYDVSYSFKLAFSGTNALQLYVNNGAGGWASVTGDTITDTNWHQVGAYSDGTNLKVFIDGSVHANSGATPASIPYEYSKDLLIGAGRWNSNLVDFHDGLIDEVRVSLTARSPGWIATEYANQNNPSAFAVVGSEEGSNCGSLTTFDSCDWPYRKKLTINRNLVVGSQANFPVLVSLASDSDLASYAQADGDDIVFTTSDGTTQLPHEIESYTPATGALTAWVMVPSVSSAANTDIYLYYGNAGSTNQQDPTGVWDSNYIGVWHLEESGTGAQGEFRDSTSYANHGQGGDGMSLYVPAQIAGKIGYGQNFSVSDGKYDFIDMGQNAVLDLSGTAITVEAWVQHQVTSNPPYEHGGGSYGILTHKGWYNGYRLAMEGDQWQCPTSTAFCANFQLPGESHNQKTTGVLSQGSWYHVAATYNGSYMAIFLNGAVSGNLMAKSDAIEPSGTGEKDVWVGHGDMPYDVGWSSEWVGKLDEIRISKTGRSDSWVKTGYNNMNNPSGFISAGSAEAAPCGSSFIPFDPCSWGYRKKITIDKTKVTGTQTDFPVLVSLSSDTDLAARAQADGDDIVFTSSDGTTQIPHEVESYSGGTLVAWVKVPSISSAANTDIYLYYGNAGTTSQQTSSSVWDTNYGAVWHLGESPSDGMAGGHLDSTSNNNDATAYNFQDGGGGTTSTAGKIDGADFFAGDDDFLSVSSPSNTDPASALTVSAWMRDDVYGDVVSRGDTYVMRLWGTGQLLCSKYNPSATWVNLAPGGVNLKDGAFHHIVCGQNTTGMFMFIDGVQKDQNADTTVFNYSLGSTLKIGMHGNGQTGYNFTGKIDEVHISKTARSDSWLTTEYKNQNSPSTFYSVGSEDTSACGGGGSCTLAIDATSTGTTATSTLTISHTTSGSDRLMLVGVSINKETGAPTVSSVTYNGVSLTSVGSQASSDNKMRMDIWKLVGPATGTHDVVITLSAAPGGATAGVMTFTGADASTPLGTFVSANGDSGTASVTVSSAAGELVFDTLAQEGSSNYDLVPGAGQTEKWDLFQANANGGGSTEAGAASVTMSWTFTSEKWATGAVPIKPCTGTTPTPTGTPLPTPTPVQTPNPPWYPNCGWPYRKNLTIDKSRVLGTQTNFPVLVNSGADSEVKAHARSDGYDILFTTSDGQTELAYERENYDSSTGALTAWVNVPSIQYTANTTLYMYYGFGSSPDMSNRQATWDSNYLGVWHLGENAVDGSQATIHYDSTTSGYNGRQNNNSRTTGKIGYAQSFNGANDWINVSTHPLVTTQLTMEAWVYPNALQANAKVISDFQRPAATFYGYQLGIGTIGGHEALYSEVNNDQGTNYMMKQGSFPINAWNYLANTWTTSGNFIGFINGTQTYSMGAGTRSIGDAAGPMNIGAPGWVTVTSFLFNGYIDEVRISNTARSANWIATTYNSTSSPTTFVYNRTQETYFCGGVPAPVYVQSKSQSSGAVSQAQITLPGSSTNGDLLVLSLVYDNTALSVSSITDSKSNTYTLAAGPTTVGAWGEAYTYYAKNIAGGGSPVTATVTLSGTPSSLLDIFFLEYAGVGTTSPLDQTNTGSGSGTAMDSGTRYVLGMPQLVYGFGADDNTCTADSPYTQRESTNGQCAMDLTAFSSGYYHVTATQNPTGAWLLQMVTFKGA